MRLNSRFVMIVVAMSCLCMTLGGCLLLLGGAAGAGTVAYVGGALQESVKATPEQVVSATNQALTSLKYITMSSESAGQTGKVTGRTGDDKAVTVEAKQEGAGISRVSIRIGTFGDEARSRILMDEIKKKL